MKYDAVIFDLFGTLVKSVVPEDYQVMLGNLSKALGVSEDDFTQHWRATLELRESGRLGGLHDTLMKTAHGAGGAPTAAQVQEAGQRWESHARHWLLPRPDARATLEGLRAKGLRIGLLSNCSAEVPVSWPNFGLSDLFDATGFSCEVGVMKPAREVYEAVTDALGVPAEHCLFVGDGGARELTGASDVGMEAVLLRVSGEEHTWFDSYYRQDALEWSGTTVGSLSDLAALV